MLRKGLRVRETRRVEARLVPRCAQNVAVFLFSFFDLLRFFLKRASWRGDVKTKYLCVA